MPATEVSPALSLKLSTLSNGRLTRYELPLKSVCLHHWRPVLKRAQELAMSCGIAERGTLESWQTHLSILGFLQKSNGSLRDDGRFRNVSESAFAGLSGKRTSIPADTNDSKQL